MYIMIKNLIKSFVERFMNRGMDTDTDKRQGLIYCYFNFPSINPFCYKILRARYRRKATVKKRRIAPEGALPRKGLYQILTIFLC